jgi:hypothetical protein
MHTVGCVKASAQIIGDRPIEEGLEMPLGVKEQCVVVKDDVACLQILYAPTDLRDQVFQRTWGKPGWSQPMYSTIGTMKRAPARSLYRHISLRPPQVVGRQSICRCPLATFVHIRVRLSEDVFKPIQDLCLSRPGKDGVSP